MTAPRLANLPAVEDLAIRFADFVESVAQRVRGLTAEPAEKAVRIVALSLPAVVLAVVAVVMLFMTLHSTLAILLGSQWAAYAVEAGLFTVLSWFVWSKRHQTAEDMT